MKVPTPEDIYILIMGTFGWNLTMRLPLVMSLDIELAWVTERDGSVGSCGHINQVSITCFTLPLSRFSEKVSATLWTMACQAALSMRFPRQEYWSGLPFPSPKESTGLYKKEDKLLTPEAQQWKLIPVMPPIMGRMHYGTWCKRLFQRSGLKEE